MRQATIFLLIGPKGSGKSFIGTLIEKEFGIKFIRVEDWAKDVKKDRAIEDASYLKEVFAVIERGIRQELYQTSKLVFESTGLTEYFDQMLMNLQEDFKVVSIGIEAGRDLCLERVRTRDQSIHIKVSDDQVNQINEQVLEKNLKTDHRLQNDQKTADQIKAELAVILSK